MRQLIRRRGDAKGGSYIDQAGREVEAARARRAREQGQEAPAGEAACPMCGSTEPHLTTDCEREREVPADGA